MMYPIERADRNGGMVIKQNVFCFEEEGNSVEMEYLTFPALEKTGIVNHLFTTRTGGVSEGIYSSLNISFERGDNPEHVLCNYERIARVMGCSADHMVASRQTHTTNIRRVSAQDMGKGVTRMRDYDDIDGLITNEKGIALVTAFADCVPLYFVDPEHEAVGLAHSGWRGTVQQMGACMVRAMQEQFGSRPEKLISAIGPSICQECYEVSAEVAEVFEEVFQSGTFGDSFAEIMEEIHRSGCYDYHDGCERKILVPGKEPGKYQLDLWLANAVILRKAGIPLNQISITDICTCHNPEYLFSHRASQGKRGNLGALLMLKE